MQRTFTIGSPARSMTIFLMTLTSKTQSVQQARETQGPGSTSQAVRFLAEPWAHSLGHQTPGHKAPTLAHNGLSIRDLARANSPNNPEKLPPMDFPPPISVFYDQKKIHTPWSLVAWELLIWGVPRDTATLQWHESRSAEEREMPITQQQLQVNYADTVR